MKKTVIIIIALAIILFTCLGFLSARSDYSYEYSFSVVGEHGTISTGWWDNAASKWHDESSPLILSGGKKAVINLNLLQLLMRVIK